ncbi:hypothetical protein DV738_g4129, partial [Chaetothyriales sp. CBS 135597]
MANNNNIKLFYSPGACSLAAHILLNEIGAKAETINLSVKNGFPEEHRGLNPKGKVPILVLNGETITENPAIFTAISQLAPERNLLGKTGLEQVRVYEYLNYLSGTLHSQIYGQIFRPSRFTDEEAALPGVKAKGFKSLGESLEYVESTLTGGVHAVGGQFTVVDVYLYVFYRWAAALGLDPEAKYPKYAALVAELLKKKSAQDALAAEDVPSFAPKL